MDRNVDFLQPSTPQAVTRPWWRRPWFILLALVAVLWFGLPQLTKFWPVPDSDLGAPSSGFTAKPGTKSSLTQAQVQQVALGSYPVLGVSTAPVTIIEFGDFECPFCKASVATMQELMKRYPDAIQFSFRHFPISDIHLEAEPAAEAAACAARQGKFWQYHDGLYKNQDSLGQALYLQLAQNLGLNRTVFSTCLTSHATAAEVNADFTEGVSLGVVGTPTWFVNGRKLEGDYPLEVWTKVAVELIRRSFTR